MAVEAKYVGSIAADYDRRKLTLNAAAEPGDVLQAGGLAAVLLAANDSASGDEVTVATSGEWEMTLTDNISAVKGVKLYWDESANTVTYQVGAAGDFYLGTCAKTVTGGTSIKVRVNLNAKPEYVSSLMTEPHNEPTITETLGLGITNQIGGSFRAQFDAVAEAATAAVLLGDGVAVTDKWLYEARFVIVDDGDDASLDFNIGMANAGHATDADSITESIFIHTDGNVVNHAGHGVDGRQRQQRRSDLRQRCGGPLGVHVRSLGGDGASLPAVPLGEDLERHHRGHHLLADGRPADRHGRHLVTRAARKQRGEPGQDDWLGSLSHRRSGWQAGSITRGFSTSLRPGRIQRSSPRSLRRTSVRTWKSPSH
jgi:predicted RecA/RadA family phage recombinase